MQNSASASLGQLLTILTSMTRMFQTRRSASWSLACTQTASIALTLVLRDFANSIRKDRNPSLPGFYADLLRLLAKDATELADEVMASAEQKAVCQGEA